MSKRRFRFHITMIIIALAIGGLFLWNSGLWLNEAKSVPNFTVIAMVLLVISQGMALKAGLKKGRKIGKFSSSEMRKKTIDRLHRISFFLIGFLVFSKLLELSPVPNWLLGETLVLGAATFFW